MDRPATLLFRVLALARVIPYHLDCLCSETTTNFLRALFLTRKASVDETSQPNLLMALSDDCISLLENVDDASDFIGLVKYFSSEASFPLNGIHILTASLGTR